MKKKEKKISDYFKYPWLCWSSKNLLFFHLVLGIANIVGKLLTGWLSDFRWVSTQMFSNVHILFCGIAVFTMPFCVNMYSAFVVTAIIFGFSSSYVILKTIVLVELLGEIYDLFIRIGSDVYFFS